MVHHEIEMIYGIEELQSGFFGSYEPIDWHVDFKSGYRWDSRVPGIKK